MPDTQLVTRELEMVERNKVPALKELLFTREDIINKETNIFSAGKSAVKALKWDNIIE